MTPGAGAGPSRQRQERTMDYGQMKKSAPAPVAKPKKAPKQDTLQQGFTKMGSAKAAKSGGKKKAC